MKMLFARVVLAFALVVPIARTLGQDRRPSEPLENVSRERAVEIAEQFLQENGYTDAPDSLIKSQLDHESVELARSRAELLEWRRNTLRPRAIGVSATDDGWGVAFDY